MRKTCHLLLAAFSLATVQLFIAPPTQGQELNSANTGTSVHQKYGQNQTIELIVGTSRVIKFDFDVPSVIVGSPDVVDAQPVASNQIMISGRRIGASGISVSDPDNNQHTINVLVSGDARQLQMTLDKLFPRSSIRAMALSTNCILTGHAQTAAEIRTAVEVANDYFPVGVVNNISLGGPNKIALECKVIEVSRTKLRDMGFDWSVATSGFSVQNSASALLDGGTGAGNFFFQIIDGADTFPMFLNLLRQNNLAKILTEPTLVTTPGRAASLLNGGLVPIPINSGLGVQSVEFREFGTKLDVLPMLEGDGRIRIEVRAEVTDVAFDLSVNGTPGFRSRHVDTGVPLREGQTLALAGLIQNRTDSTSRGIPGLKDMPWVGSLFRRVEDTFNEVELIILVTPRFVSEVDPSMIPDGPGTNTVQPCDTDFFFRGYQEVPRTGHGFELGPVRRNGGYSTAPTFQGNSAIQMAPAMQNQIAPIPNSNGVQLNDQQLNNLDQARRFNNQFPTSTANANSFRPVQTNQRTINNFSPANRTASVPSQTPYTKPLPKFHLSDNN